MPSMFRRFGQNCSDRRVALKHGGPQRPLQYTTSPKPGGSAHSPAWYYLLHYKDRPRNVQTTPITYEDYQFLRCYIRPLPPALVVAPVSSQGPSPLTRILGATSSSLGRASPRAALLEIGSGTIDVNNSHIHEGQNLPHCALHLRISYQYR